MARSQTYLARCDRKECKTVLEVEQNTLAPEGWIQIRTEIDGKWDAASTLEFCSEKCVSIWARDRRAYQNGNGHNPTDTVRETVLEAISLLDKEFKSREIQELTGSSQSTVDRNLTKLVEEGLITVVSPGSGKPNDPRIYARGGDAN